MKWTRNRPLRLFCFPCAGAGASAFHAWKREFSGRIELCPVLYPGRETRLQEAAIGNISLLVQEIFAELSVNFDRPFAFFGHSFGATVCFELARLLQEHGISQPWHVFVAGCGAPQLPIPNPTTHMLPRRSLVAELSKLGGIPPEVSECEELLDLLLPTIRADYQAHESYRYKSGPKLDCSISILGGREDKTVSIGQLEAWSEQTNASARVHLFPGGHFFPHTGQQAVCEVIAADLNLEPVFIQHKPTQTYASY